MDAKQFLQTYPDEAETVALRSGTTLIYLRMIGWGHKRPSPKLARSLELASNGRMTRTQLRPDIWEEPDPL